MAASSQGGTRPVARTDEHQHVEREDAPPRRRNPLRKIRAPLQVRSAQFFVHHRRNDEIVHRSNNEADGRPDQTGERELHSVSLITSAPARRIATPPRRSRPSRARAAETLSSQAASADRNGSA